MTERADARRKAIERLNAAIIALSRAREFLPTKCPTDEQVVSARDGLVAWRDALAEGKK